MLRPDDAMRYRPSVVDVHRKSCVVYDKGHIHHMEVNVVLVEEAYSGLAKKYAFAQSIIVL